MKAPKLSTEHMHEEKVTETKRTGEANEMIPIHSPL